MTIFFNSCLLSVTELVGRGSLWDVLREPNLNKHTQGSDGGPMQGEWNWERLRQVATGIACGMAYLHGIKPQAVKLKIFARVFMCVFY